MVTFSVKSGEGDDPAYGARPLRRAIQRLIENSLSERIIQGDFKAGDIIKVTAADGKIQYEKM